MSKKIPLRGKDPCPICDSHDGRCRKVHDGNKEFILCMQESDRRKGDIVGQWKCIKENDPTKSYSCTTWAIDNSQEWTEERRREWEREHQQRRRQQQRELEEQRRRSLPAEVRHWYNISIVDRLSLHPDDLADLQRRGFSPEEIELSGFKSVDKYQKLNQEISYNLPGVANTKNNLINKDEGYLCPIYDVDGNLVAFQIRIRNPQDGNRYKWLSGGNGVLKLFPESSEGGENPLAVFRPKGKPVEIDISESTPEEKAIEIKISKDVPKPKPVGIGISEGTGAKPFLFSQRFNLAVIGAAGGQFLSSIITFKNSLEKLSLEVGKNQIFIAIDAGDIINSKVIKRWVPVISQLEEWGYKPTILWWGQFAKEDSDIDELSNFAHIQYLSPSEFIELTKKAKIEAEKTERIKAKQAKIEQENAIYKELTTIQEKPWKQVNQELLDLEDLDLEPGAIYIISSAKGTGKTRGIKPILAKYNSGYAWFSRIALGREECHKLGILWKDESAKYGGGKRRGFCADSAHQFDPKNISNRGFLLVDECDQVFDHIFGETCNKDGKRPLILVTLEAHLESCMSGDGIGIFMSADISQKEIDYIKSIAPIGYPVRLIKNNYEPPKCDLYFNESPTPDGLIEMLLSELEDDVPCFIIDDIKNGTRGAKSIAEYIREVHPEWKNEIVEINSDTSGEKEITQFLKNINEASKSKRLISCTPSVVSGISIENGRFVNGVYGFFNGILTVNNASQALSRVRGAEVVNVWAAETGLVYAGNRATDPKEINAYYQRNYEANSKHILSYKNDYDAIKGEWKSPHWELKLKNDAYRNLCISKLRERLKAKLSEEGYYIISTMSAGSDMVKNGLKTAWSKIELDYAFAVANASILSDEELEAKQFSSEPLTPEEKLDVEKTYLLKSFGQELIDATTFVHKESGQVLIGFAAMCLKNERGDYKRRLENFYLFSQDVEEAIKKDLADEYKQIKHGCGRFPGDIRWRARARKCREFLGIQPLLNPDRWTTPNDYRELASKAKAHAPQVKDALGVNIENIKTDSQVFVELVEQLGLKLDSQWVEGGVDPNSQKRKRFKKRRISTESWQFAQMYVNYRFSLKNEEASTAAATETSSLDVPPLSLYRESILEGRSIQDEDNRGTIVSEPEAQPQQLNLFEQKPGLDLPALNLCTESVLEGGPIQDPSFKAQRPTDIGSEISDELDRAIASFATCFSREAALAAAAKYKPQIVERALFLQQPDLKNCLRKWLESAQESLPWKIGQFVRVLRKGLCEGLSGKIDMIFGFQGIRVQIDVGSFRTWEGLEVGEFELLPISS